MEILHRGFDGLDIAFQGQITAALATELEIAKGFAARTHQLYRMCWKGLHMAVAETGARGGYTFRCETENAIWFFKKPNGRDPWGVRVSVKSLPLAIYGLGWVRNHLFETLSQLDVCTFSTGLSISRVDYAVDVLLPSFTLDADNFVMHARCNRKTHEEITDITENGHSGRVTSVTIGKNPGRQVIIYDKREESIAKHKAYWPEIWNANRRHRGQPPVNKERFNEAKEPDFTPHKRTSEAGIKRYYRQVEKMNKRANRVFSASLSLDMMTPVLAEAFINLVIFLMRKDELKWNARQYDQYKRQQIDTRVFDLHLKCDHFTKGVDPDREEYKAFKRVMDRRNHHLHGNIDPVKDGIETVYFDKFTPLFEKGADPILELFRKKESVFDIPGVLSRYLDVHSFFQYVLGLIEKRPRAEIEMLMKDETIGYDTSRSKAGRLFPGHEVMMVMPLHYDDELKVDWK